MLIIDVSNLFNPYLLISYPSFAYDVSVQNNLAFVANGSHFLILNISNLFSINLIGYCNTNSKILAVEDSIAVVDTIGGLNILDISNLSDPTVLQFIHAINGDVTFGLAISNKIVFFMDGGSVLWLFNV